MKARSTVLALRSVCVAALAFAAPTALHAQSTDHFTCYKAKVASGATPFEAVEGVGLVDQFRASTVEVRKPKLICAPTNKLGEDPSAPSHPEHLVDHAIKPTVKFVTAPLQRVVDQFGTLFVDVKKPVALQVPTAKSRTSPPAPLTPVLDHFTCYRVKVSRSTPKFVRVLGVTLEDQLGFMQVDVIKPRRLCAPTDKRNEEPGAENHPDHLMCYRVRQTSLPRFVPVSPLFVNNQFGPSTLTARKPSELCVPALKNPPVGATVTPTPGTPVPNDTATPTETVVPTVTPTPVCVGANPPCQCIAGQCTGSGCGGFSVCSPIFGICQCEPPTPAATTTPTPTATATATPTATLTAAPTVTVTPTPTVTPTFTPGGGEPTPTPTETPPCPDLSGVACPTSVQTEADGQGIDLDTGWSGQSHDSKAPSMGRLTLAVSGCSGGPNHPCGQCTVSGPITNDGGTAYNNQRCVNDTAIECTGDADCTGVGGPCHFFFGAPLPLSSGGVSVCVTNELTAPVVGTANIEAGSSAALVTLRSRVHTGPTNDKPCPNCTAGVCDSGPHLGDPCTVNGSSPIFGDVSFDCPPDPGGNIGDLPIPLDLRSGTQTRALTVDSPNCSAPGFGGTKCFCDTCNSPDAEPCLSNADCPDPPGSTGPICGGKRCQGGTNNGAACTSPSECPPGAPTSACGVPGSKTRPNECNDTICTPNTPPDGGSCDEGVCAAGPFDRFCAIDTFRGCAQDVDCPRPGDFCSGKFRECFPDNGLVGTRCYGGGGTNNECNGGGNNGALCTVPSECPGGACQPALCTTLGDCPDQTAGSFCGGGSVTTCGATDPRCGNTAHPKLGALFCVPPTTSSSINSVAGLPALGRVGIPGTSSFLPAVATATPGAGTTATPTPTRTATPTTAATATLTATRTPTPTPTTTPLGTCGNGVLDLPGEQCDPTAPPGGGALCDPSACVPPLAGVGFACTCGKGQLRTLYQPSAELDSGWTGTSHNSQTTAPADADVLLYDCDNILDNECQVIGPRPGPWGFRCELNPRIVCTSDANCAPLNGRCGAFLGAPLPLSSGGVPVCVTSFFTRPVTGTINVSTGSTESFSYLLSKVHVSPAIDAPCPRCNCTGPLCMNQVGAAGTCSGGSATGQACTIQGLSPSFGPMSRDCPPESNANVSGSGLDIRFLPTTTGTSTKTAALQCNAPGFTQFQCPCDTCAGGTTPNAPCASNADCPGGGVCGATRCIGGTSDGALCATAAQCPPGAPVASCGRPGLLTQPNGCEFGCDGGPNNDVACAVDSECPSGACVPLCRQLPGLQTGMGQCVVGPSDGQCSMEPFRGCNPNLAGADCNAPPPTCIIGAGTCTGCTKCGQTCNVVPRPCHVFPMVLQGTPDPFVLNDTAGNGFSVNTFCIPPTTSPAVNSSAGLPSEGAIISPNRQSKKFPPDACTAACPAPNGSTMACCP